MQLFRSIALTLSSIFAPGAPAPAVRQAEPWTDVENELDWAKGGIEHFGARLTAQDPELFKQNRDEMDQWLAGQLALQTNDIEPGPTTISAVELWRKAIG